MMADQTDVPAADRRELAEHCQRAGLRCRGLGSLTQLLGAAAAALGVGDRVPTLSLPSTDRMVVVMVDGLGLHNLVERSGHAPFLRTLLGGPHLTSTFPSTTAAALSGFGTGQLPGRTSMLGYTVKVPATGGIGNLISWDGVPKPEIWQQETPWFERIAATGTAVTNVGPGRFQQSSLSQAAFRGASYRAAESLSARVDVTLELLRRPGLVYLYWGDIDKIGHRKGWQSHDWGDAVTALDGELQRLSRRLPRGAVMALTADHGMVDIDRAKVWDVGTDAVLSQDVPLITGEPRAMQLHLAPQTDVKAVMERWRNKLGSSAMVVPQEIAVAGGLFGEVSAHVRPVLGQVTVAMSGRAVVADTRTQTQASLNMVGVHGSLTKHELDVPLLVTVG